MLLAMVGGIIVAAGLAIEKTADFLDSRFLGEYRAHKMMELFGWWVLMVGIFIEIADAGWTAMEISRNDPHKMPIMALSGWMRLEIRPLQGVQDDGTHIRVSGANSMRFRQDNLTNLEWVSLELESFGNSKKIRFLEKSGKIGSRAISLNDSGDKCERFDLFFEPDDSLFNSESLSTSEINVLRIGIPRWSSRDDFGASPIVVGGQAELTINSSLPKNFIIPPQTNVFHFATSLATNGTFVPLTFEQLRQR